MYFIGLDAGSVAIKAVVLNENGNKLEGFYVRHYGHPVTAAMKLLKEIYGKYPQCTLSVTGSSGKTIASVLSVTQYNEVVSQSYSVKKLYPHIKTVIELGGEDSKLIILENGSIKDFSMNSVCAAGTGSFLEQQAERLRLRIEQFSEIASESKKPSKIAGRCSVFAKSDMIHLQQIATPVEDIVAGLCFAVARNFKGTIAKGREIKNPVAFQGGVAANKGMVRAFKEIFELDELFVPPDFALMGAIGAAFKAIDEGCINSFDLSLLESFVSSSKFTGDMHSPLISKHDDFFERHLKDRNTVSGISNELKNKDTSRISTYLGIDIGSISTNLAVIDDDGRLLAKCYLMTAGRPIEAVKQGLSEIYGELGDSVEIKGVGTTGSGRYMIADYVGADIVKNEITAQATAAIYIDPNVDTIFEIGGQDSKYISIKDGIIVDFEMNKACAAGTGSFIEEQAEKLNISVKDEFAECSFKSCSPCRLGERCTVFMENSLMANLQKGAEKDDLLAGLSYSIVQNYINRVVAGRHIGDNIFFQGGVAFNKAVVAAFEKYIGRTVTVPPNHDVTGAIGMALIARDYMKDRNALKDTSCITHYSSRFKGFEMATRPYEISSFECKGCANICEINRVKVEGEEGFLFYGGRCEKYDIRKSQKSEFEDLFAFREEMLYKAHLKRVASGNGQRSRVKIGIPNIFFFHNYLPFWATFLWELGFEVVVSPKTNKQIITLGVENVISEACFPVKVAHGHIKYLAEAGVDAIFVPSFINMNMSGDDFEYSLACPYVQTIPYVSRMVIHGIRMLSPVINMLEGKKRYVNNLLSGFKEYGIKRHEIERALKSAEIEQTAFVSSIKNKGIEIMSQIKSESSSFVVAIVGRAYNAFDSGVNLEIPKKLSHIRTLSIPMDMLPLKNVVISDTWTNMYWRSGQNILKAARIIKNIPNLYAIFIGNFSCGPDSFILKYFKEEMADKPFLYLEIDEHSADAGAVTRCEAFLDSIEQQSRSLKVQKLEAIEKNNRLPRFSASAIKKRTIYIPRMAEHAFALQGAFEYCGVRAEALPVSDKDSIDIARRYVSGKECYPYIVTAGDMLKKAFSPDFKEKESAFFMPSGSGPCRFGQYNVAHSLILQKAGFENVPIFAPNQDVEFYKEIGVVGSDFSMRAWQGIIAYELLIKCLHETRPYEKENGDSDALHLSYSRRLYETIKSKNGHMPEIMRQMKKDFSSIPVRKEKRPLVGIVGEIFVRFHEFSNEELIRKVEKLGGEVWLAPFEEWIYYITEMSFRKALIKKDWSAIKDIFVKKHFQKAIEHKYGKIFKDFLKTGKEPKIADIFKKAAPYVPDSFEGETVLSIGKAIDLIQMGASGIICTMPFSCMPGTIVTALMKAVSKDYDVPCISIPYDGTESTATSLQLEAFMEAVKR